MSPTSFANDEDYNRLIDAALQQQQPPVPSSIIVDSNISEPVCEPSTHVPFQMSDTGNDAASESLLEQMSESTSVTPSTSSIPTIECDPHNVSADHDHDPDEFDDADLIAPGDSLPGYQSPLQFVNPSRDVVPVPPIHDPRDVVLPVANEKNLMDDLNNFDMRFSPEPTPTLQLSDQLDSILFSSTPRPKQTPTLTSLNVDSEQQSQSMSILSTPTPTQTPILTSLNEDEFEDEIYNPTMSPSSLINRSFMFVGVIMYFIKVLLLNIMN
jgi:hypothetical protein